MPMTLRKTGKSPLDVFRRSARDWKRLDDALNRRMAEAFLKKLVEYLRIGAVSFRASPVAIQKWPCFENPSRAFDAYISCLKIEQKGREFSVVIDDEALEKAGLPGNFADLIEHGHPDGVSQISHWGRVEQEFAGTAVATQIAQEVVEGKKA